MTFRNSMTAMLVAMSVTGCSIQPDRVGSYIYSEPDGAMMVQIESIESGRVTGSLSIVAAGDDGKTNATKQPLSGTIEGNSLNLSIENGSGVSLVTGAIDGNDLRITIFGDGDSTQATLSKRDASKFEELANASRNRAAEKLQQVEVAAASKERIEQRSEIQKSIDRLADSIFEKSSEVQDKSKKTELVIADYRQWHSRSGKMRNAKQNLDARSIDDAYQISQIDYQIDAMSNDMALIHGQVKSYMDSLNGFIAETDLQFSQFLSECSADELLNCARLSTAKQSLSVKYQQFQKAYDREKAAFGGKQLSQSVTG